jgi:L-fuconolactonase
VQRHPRTPVVDAHQHFWFDPTVEDYPWMVGDVSPIRRTFGPDDLRPLLVAAGIDYTVVVQTRSSLEETKSFLELADRTDFLAGVVGWVDLTDPDIAAVLRDLRSLAGGKYLVGIRHQVHDESDARWLLRQDVLRGLGAVAAAGLAYDLLVRTRELPAAVDVARRFPSLQFVVDHIAKPPIAAGEIDEWAEEMAPLSDLPNVSCKLSGMVTEADWSAWSVEDLIPYVERVVGWFGPDRLMFGSDWPVCRLAASYADVVTAYHAAIGSLLPEAQNAIFGATAISFYRLPIDFPP